MLFALPVFATIIRKYAKVLIKRIVCLDAPKKIIHFCRRQLIQIFKKTDIFGASQQTFSPSCFVRALESINAGTILIFYVFKVFALKFFSQLIQPSKCLDTLKYRSKVVDSYKNRNIPATTSLEPI